MLKQISFVCLNLIFAISIITVEAQDQTTKLQPIGEEAYQVMSQFFEYEKDIPLNARIVETTEMENCVREKIVFTGIRNSRVPGYLVLPKNGKQPYPCVLLLHGYTGSKSVWLKDDDQDEMGYEWKYSQIADGLLAQGYALLALDMPYHGERKAIRDYEPPNNILQYNWMIQGLDMISWAAIDYRKAVDYISSRPEINASRIGVMGQSGGGWLTFMISALESRVKVSVATVTPIRISQNKNEVVPSNFAPRIVCPFLMIMGRQDDWYAVDEGDYLFGLIKSPIKNIIWYDSGHNLPIEHVDDAVSWFREHL